MHTNKIINDVDLGSMVIGEIIHGSILYSYCDYDFSIVVIDKSTNEVLNRRLFDTDEEFYFQIQKLEDELIMIK